VRRHLSNRARERMPTAFESKVHAVVRNVPKGKVTTYGAVAKVAGGCARSVGAVMRKNCPAETRVP
jgi:alkylated DNA nucleotide flippase Atl1